VSSLKVDTVQSRGGGAVTLTNQSAAKHFINFDASSGTPTSQKSFNVSSLTDSAAGKFGINFTNNYDDTNFSLSGYANGSTVNSFTGEQSLGLGTSLTITTTTSTHELLSFVSGGSYTDSKHCDAQGFGDLA
tara:strand:- start:71 stop:466 length:396 start_codon:yes stop_codon:yes gene_type:complete